MLNKNRTIKAELHELLSMALGDVEITDAEIDIVVNYIFDNNVLPLPAMPGDILYEIRKVCDTNDGRREEYKPNIEYDTPCKYYEPASWYDDSDSCRAVEDYFEGSYCDLNLKVFCDECKNRFAIQKTTFQWSDMDRVVGTAMYKEDTELFHRKYLTEEDAKEALEEILNENLE